ncbi:MAG: MFS transporter [Rhizobiales bacterium]|nr:MFS transporter [Hyphomicrobiales bacterium]
MFSNRLAATLQRRHVHYGWVVVGVTFLTMLVTAGALGAGGVLIVPLEKEFGWSTAEISTAIALRILLYGLLGPFAAAFLNRFGLRPVVVVALVMIGGGYLLSLFMGELWQLIVLWGVVVGVGSGLTALVLGATVATRWFTHRRGLVVGMMTASSATGQLVFLPILASLTEAFGWRAALLFITATLVIVIAAVLLLMRDRPSDLGLPAYGESTVTPPPPAPAGLSVLITSPLLALRDASRSRTFWVLFATFFVCGASTNGLIQTHFISLCGDYGIEAVHAAGLLAVIGIFDFFGTILSGWLSDRYDNRWLLFWYYGLRGLSLAALPFTDFSFYGLSLFAVFYGLDWVATVPPTVRLTAENFGRERANLVFGWIFAGHQIGAATAAFSAGLSRTELASYLPAFFGAGVLCLIAAVLALTIGRARRSPATVTQGV